MKENDIKKISLWIFVTMICCFVIAWALMGASGDNMESIFKGGNTIKYTVDQEESYSFTDISKIDVNLTSIDVNFIFEDREDVKANLIGEVYTNNEKAIPTLDVKNSGATISIKTIYATNSFSYNKSNLRMNVYIPKEYKQKIKVDVSSADITLKDAKIKSLELDTTSGDFQLSNIELEDLLVDTSSGDGEMSNILCENFDYEATSGNLNGERIITNQFNYGISSGDIDITNLKGKNVKGNSTSGLVQLQISKFDKDAIVDIKASSGDVELKLPSDVSFYLDAECSSGDIKCEYPITINNSMDDDKLEGIVGDNKDNNKIIIETTSGDVKIEK